MLKGMPVSPGIGMGNALLIAARASTNSQIAMENPAAERLRFDRAVAAAAAQIESLRDAALFQIGPENARIFAAHLQLLHDSELHRAVQEGIAKGIPAETALQLAIDHHSGRLARVAAPYLRERALDLRDVGQRLIDILSGGAAPLDLAAGRPRIVIAPYLPPAVLIQASPGSIAGFVMDQGGMTCHTAIIARSLGIPGVSGIKYPPGINDGVPLMVDGTEGRVVIAPNAAPRPRASSAHRGKQRRRDSPETNPGLYPAQSMQTADGTVVRLCVNIDSTDNSTGFSTAAVDGVGLLRTESFFLGRATLPSEAEQFEFYKQVLTGWAGKPVVFRTLDLGGDKPLPPLTDSAETNPSLGCRGIRLCLSRPELFAAQLRAILKASVYGNSKIIFPMVGSLEELRAAQSILNGEKAKLRAAGIAFQREIPVGVLIETPAAALLTDHFAKETDFFSVGTNDLIQYTLGVDRMNTRVAHLYDPFHPAVLRLLQQIAVPARQAGKPLGICGEAAGEPLFIPVLLQLGFTEFSVAPDRLAAARRKIAAVNLRDFSDLPCQLATLATAAEVRRFLETRSGQPSKSPPSK